MSDYISKSETIKALRNYADQKHYGGEVELANGILKAVCFIEKEDNIPTISETEIIRNPFERVVERLKSERVTESFKALKNANETYIKGCIDNRVFAYSRAIKIIKEECEISE